MDLGIIGSGILLRLGDALKLRSGGPFPIEEGLGEGLGSNRVMDCRQASLPKGPKGGGLRASLLARKKFLNAAQVRGGMDHRGR